MKGGHGWGRAPLAGLGAVGGAGCRWQGWAPLAGLGAVGGAGCRWRGWAGLGRPSKSPLKPWLRAVPYTDVWDDEPSARVPSRFCTFVTKTTPILATDLIAATWHACAGVADWPSMCSAWSTSAHTAGRRSRGNGSGVVPACVRACVGAGPAGSDTKQKKGPRSLQGQQLHPQLDRRAVCPLLRTSLPFGTSPPPSPPPPSPVAACGVAHSLGSSSFGSLTSAPVLFASTIRAASSASFRQTCGHTVRTLHSARPRHEGAAVLLACYIVAGREGEA
jgi:hypothetical protein